MLPPGVNLPTFQRSRPITTRIVPLRESDTVGDICFQSLLTLGALLLGSDNFEIAAIERTLLLLLLQLLYTRCALFSYLAPAAARFVVGRARRIAFVDDAFVRELTAT